MPSLRSLLLTAVLVGTAAAPLRAQSGDTLRLDVAIAARLADTLRLDLATAARLAADRSASVEVERQAELVAAAQVTEDRASLLPHLSLDAGHGRRTFNTASFGIDFPTPPGQAPIFDPNGEVLGPVTTIDLRGGLGQTLFDWSAVERVRSAGASLAASRTGTDAARARAAFAAAAAYVQDLRASGRLTAREADLAVVEELLGVARELLDAGVGVRLDVTRAEAQRAALVADLVVARAAADRARLQLLRALSLPLDTSVRLAPASEAVGSGPDPAAAVAAALERRADLKEIVQRIDAARLDVAAVRAERLPTVALGAGEGITGKQYDHILSTYEWTLRVSVPLFDGMRIGAREQVERAQVSALEARHRELVEQIDFEVRDALLQLESAREMVGTSRVRLALAEAELEQARERFSAGVAGSADVFTASLRLTEARTAEVDARAAYEAARVALAEAEGAVEELR